MSKYKICNEYLLYSINHKIEFGLKLAETIRSVPTLKSLHVYTDQIETYSYLLKKQRDLENPENSPSSYHLFEAESAWDKSIMSLVVHLESMHATEPSLIEYLGFHMLSYNYASEPFPIYEKPKRATHNFIEKNNERNTTLTGRAATGKKGKLRCICKLLWNIRKPKNRDTNTYCFVL